MNERNRSPFEEVNVKPITQTQVDLSNYKKGAYLQPFKHQRNGSISEYAQTGDQLGLQPQIHKRFLSLAANTTTMSSSAVNTTTNKTFVEMNSPSMMHPLDMSLNNVQFNRLINKKRNIEAAWTKPSYPNATASIEAGTSLT